jgi:hypothetical protein
MTFEEQQTQARQAVRDGIAKIRAKLDQIDANMQNGMAAAECFTPLNEAVPVFLDLKVLLENVREFDMDMLLRQERALALRRQQMGIKRIGG